MPMSMDERDREIEGISSTMPENDDALHEALEGEVIELEDGSAIVTMGEEEEQEDATFGENLAKRIPKSERYQIANELIEAVKKDKTAREKRQKQYEDGIRRTGLGDDAPGGAQFNGASRAVHPMLAEACVDFEARAIKELMPSGGPVRTSITSESDDERVQVAELKRDVLNLQLTKRIPEYRDELESLLSQLPLGGSQYMKIWHDGKRKRVEFVPIDHVFLPYNNTNFYSAPRVTHQQFIDRYEYESRIASKLYLEDSPTVAPSSDSLDRSVVDVANDKVEGKENSDAYNEDGLREVFEIYLDKDFKEYDTLAEGAFAPYVAHVDVHTSELLGLYRNWKEADENQEKLHWMVEWGFVPWRGAYKLGLPHLIGGLSAAATGALRALLDSAHAANAPTLLKLRGQGRFVGQTTEVAITQVQEIEGPAGIDDVRKLAMPIPFAGPNPVLYELLGFLVNAGKGVVTTAEEKIADASSTMPVGTSLALIEQGSKVFSAIHMRLHASQARVFEILCRLNADYPEPEVWEKDVGRPVDPRIFSSTEDISPVSDPNIFSEAQRFAQNQAVMQLMGDPTIPYNRIEAHRRMLRLLNVPDLDQLLPAPPRPKKADPVQENMRAVSGVPLKAFPDQDHLAHVETHLRFITSPLFGAGPAFSGQQLAPLLAHCGEHLTMFYPQVVAMTKATALAQGVMLPDTTEERSQAVAMSGIDQVANGSLGPILQLLQQAQQLVQSKMPPPPMDPQAQVTMQVAQMEDARAKMQMQLEEKNNALNLQLKQVDQQFKQRLDQMKAMGEQQQSAREQMQRMQIEEMARQVELLKNQQDNRQHQITELMKNREDNQAQIIIARMKEEMALNQKQLELLNAAFSQMFTPEAAE